MLVNNPRIIGYLTQALHHEMSAVQQYLTQANLCELWGMPAEARTFYKESNEELVHAGRLIQHMLKLGSVPNGTQLAPVRPGRDFREMLILDRHREEEVVRLYHEAALYCTRFRDEESAQLFTELMRDEQHHLSEIDAMLAASQNREQQYGY